MACSSESMVVVVLRDEPLSNPTRYEPGAAAGAAMRGIARHVSAAPTISLLPGRITAGSLLHHALRDPCRRSWYAVPAATRRLDDENVARGDLRLVGIGQVRARAIGALDPVAPDVSGPAARHPVRRDSPMSREDRSRHRLEEAHAARGAVAAVPLALAGAALADRMLVDAHREAPLEHLGIGQARIGHVALHGIGAVEAVACPRAAGDRLVVLVAVVAEGEVF